MRRVDGDDGRGEESRQFESAVAVGGERILRVKYLVPLQHADELLDLLRARLGSLHRLDPERRTFSRLIFDQVLRVPRGVNFCSQVASSNAFFCPSIQP